jgi:lipoprotein NlpD
MGACAPTAFWTLDRVNSATGAPGAVCGPALEVRPVFVLVAVMAALILVACSSTGPAPVDGWGWKGPVPRGYYLVRSGDTLSEVAEKRHLKTRDLIRWNKLKPPYVIYAGKLLRIAPPERSGVAASPAPAKPRTRQERRSASVPRSEGQRTPGSRAAGSGVTWAWPLDGALRQGFRAGDRTHQGLRIACRPGEQVRAAATGKVAYAGSGLKAYGNLIIVKHNEKYLSAYGFNRRLLVAEGVAVTRGQALAECGQGAEGVYLLHFEIRRDGVAVDPVPYLPPRP